MLEPRKLPSCPRALPSTKRRLLLTRLKPSVYWARHAVAWPSGGTMRRPFAQIPPVPERASPSADEGAMRRHEAQGEVAKVEALLERGAPVEARTDTGATALMVAAGAGVIAVVRVLLEHGAHVTAADHAGATALLLAAFKVRVRQRVPTPRLECSRCRFSWWPLAPHSPLQAASSLIRRCHTHRRCVHAWRCARWVAAGLVVVTPPLSQLAARRHTAIGLREPQYAHHLRRVTGVKPLPPSSPVWKPSSQSTPVTSRLRRNPRRAYETRTSSQRAGLDDVGAAGGATVPGSHGGDGAADRPCTRAGTKVHCTPPHASLSCTEDPSAAGTQRIHALQR
jgi:hypothetical protein